MSKYEELILNTQLALEKDKLEKFKVQLQIVEERLQQLN